MDRNSVIGLLLIGMILVGYSIWMAPTEEELEDQQRMRDSIEAAANQIQSQKAENYNDTTMQPLQEDASLNSVDSASSGNSDSLQNLELIQRHGIFAAASQGEEELFQLENEKLKVTFSNKGGRVTSVELKEYKTYDQMPVVLMRGDSSEFGLNFFSQNRDISTDRYFFDRTGSTDSTVVYRLTASNGTSIDYYWKIPKTGYLVDYSITLNGFNRIVSQNTNFIDLNWKQDIFQKELSLENEKVVSTIYYKYPDDEADYLSETDNDEENLSTKAKWVSFKQQYFNATLIAEESFSNPTRLRIFHNESEEDSLMKVMSANFTIPYNRGEVEQFVMHFYFGPNHFQTLKRLDLGLEKLIPLGWGIFGWVNKFIVIEIFNFLSKFNMNYGLIIFILTIAIKLMLLPLTYKAYKSTAKMKVLRPEMEEIQKKYKDDQMKSQQELMGLYRKAGVNPLGGCLPMLLQLPILIAMFRFFPASIELRQEGFLWATDLSTYDSILDLPFSIPFYGDHVSLFTILMTVSTLLYTYMNSQMTAANPQMKWMMYLMPVMFLGIFNNYSSGLSYYYFLANMISFGQQYIFRSFVDEDALHKKIQENKKKPQNKKKSKFQKRLEQMAKERGYQARK